MSLPKTHLLMAPSDAINPFGTGMHSTDLLNALRRINTNINMPLPHQYSHWYPGAVYDMTTLWLGAPHVQGSKIICTLKCGVIPEFTQIDSDGYIIDFGWRAVLRRCIMARAATKHAIERQFRISLDEDAAEPDCRKCLGDGIRGVKSSHRSGYCDNHEMARMEAERARENRKEHDWLKSHPQPNVGRVYVA